MQRRTQCDLRDLASSEGVSHNFFEDRSQDCKTNSSSCYDCQAWDAPDLLHNDRLQDDKRKNLLGCRGALIRALKAPGHNGVQAGLLHQGVAAHVALPAPHQVAPLPLARRLQRQQDS